MKILNLFFNFGLVIDEILHYSLSRNGLIPNMMMKDVVVRWASSIHGVTQTDFDNLIGVNGLRLNDSTPDVVIPTLLSHVRNPTGNIPKEVYIMLIAYKLRNHGGHNLNQQSILSTKYKEILENLFFALFLAIQSIKL